MSLVNFALRTCLKRALKGHTLAEDRVSDSTITPLPELVDEDAKPQIVVSTDDDVSQGAGLDLLGRTRALDLVIEIVVAGVVSVDADSVAFDVPATDAGLEAALDFVQHGLFRALAEPGNAWGQLFLDLVGTISKIVKRRGADTKNGVRFAARQIVITCDPAPEPAFGAALEPDSGFDRFLALLRADDEMAEYADIVEGLILGEPLPSWRALQAMLGTTEPTMRALGLSPYDPQETGEPPLLAAVQADQRDAAGSVIAASTGTADGVEILHHPG